MAVKHSIPHDLDSSTVQKVATLALNQYATQFAQYDPKIEWKGANQAEILFKAAGATLKGSLQLRSDAIELELDVPLLLRPFRTKAIQVLEDEVKVWLEKARRGTLD